ncbi:MAG: hypothetical protein QM754_21015 [Tepidisphaeraceae bacterium]
MIKKLFGVVTGVFALNFLAIAAGIGFLVFTHKLDREKVQAVREIILNGAATQPSTQPTTQQAATQPSPEDAPMLRLDALLAKYSRRPAGEQIELVRAELDSQAATVERRRREVADQRVQIENARSDLKNQLEKLDTDRKQFEAEKTEQARLAADAGFQKTLELYQQLPAKQIKTMFAGMDDETVVRYLQAMDTRQAGSVLKEFKTPQETTRAQGILEKMRAAQAKAD